jgi:LysM repeat protein
VSRRALVGSVLLALAAASPARAAGDAAGTAAGSFLAIGTGTSALSMAGATVASGNDLAAASWNVASLARLDALQFSLAHSPLPGGSTQDWLAGGGRLGGGGTRWGMQALFQREGDLEGRDAANNPTGSLSVNDLAVGASLAQPIGPNVTAGLGVRWVHESLAGTNGSGASLDAGLRADVGQVGVALAARGLGGVMHYPGATYDLPQAITGGVSWADEGLGVRLNADFESPRDYYNSARVGGEWLWRDRVAFRAGYRLALGAPSDATTSGPAFGIGAGVGTMWLDYAFVLDGGSTSGEHRVGLTFRPGMVAMGGSVRGERTAVEPSSRPEGRSTVARPGPVMTAPAPGATRPPPPAAPHATTSPAPAAPRVTTSSTPSPPPASARPTWIVVAPGETLASIAQRWGTTVAAIMMTNNLVSDKVTPGKQLKLPESGKR